ncbi:AMP-binding protein [Methylobacterium radiodurans]|nr:AMP-binding protein [Methylobacterium radiodurans]
MPTIRPGAGRQGLAAFRPQICLPQIVAEAAAVHGPAPAFAGPAGCTSYAAFGADLARYARYAEAEGFGSGNTVALLMRHGPASLALWLGFALAGARVALVDASLSGACLARTLASLAPRLLVADPDCAEGVQALAALIPEMPAVRWHGPGADFARIDIEAAEYEGEELAGPGEVGADDAALLACSGHRGAAPTVAAASHRQILAWAQGASLGLPRAIEVCPAEFRAVAEACGVLLRGGVVVVESGPRPGTLC